ncbi:sensor histidine kinase [Shewanella sp. A14]
MLTQFYQHSRNTSKSYRAAMMIMFWLHFVLTWSVMLSLVEMPQHHYSDIILRSFLEASLLVFICHCLLRPYLRMNMLGASMDIRVTFLGLAYIFFVSFIYFLLSYGLGKLSFLQSTDISQIQVMTQEGKLGGEVTTLAIFVIGILESFATLFLWCVAYLVWQFHKNKKELQLEVNESQIQQLTNQLSPHFLFNTLNSIRALIFADQEKAAEVVTLLSDLLRNQMQSQMKIKSTLEQDWLITDKYLAIEKVRFDKKLQLTVQLAEATLNQKIPTLTLLTLAENAIKHGISTSRKPGFIHVESEVLNDDYWRLTITNSVFAQKVLPSTKVGIHNVKKRLELMFANKYQFFNGLDQDQFLVSMELPYVKSANR